MKFDEIDKNALTSKFYEEWDETLEVPCRVCHGTGMDRYEEFECAACFGEGVEPPVLTELSDLTGLQR